MFLYLFDSNGIQLEYVNYAAWRRISLGRPTVDDIRFAVHEVEELGTLHRSGLDDPTGRAIDSTDVKEWQKRFVGEQYPPAHRQALEKEVRFVADIVAERTDGVVRLSPDELAMSDSTNTEAAEQLLRDGKPLQQHARARSWNRRDEPAVLSEKVANALRLPVNTTIGDVIRATKSANWSAR